MGRAYGALQANARIACLCVAQRALATDEDALVHQHGIAADVVCSVQENNAVAIARLAGRAVRDVKRIECTNIIHPFGRRG